MTDKTLAITTITFGDMVVRSSAVRGISAEKDPMIGSINRNWRVLLDTTSGRLHSKHMDFADAMAEFHRLCAENGASNGRGSDDA